MGTGSWKRSGEEEKPKSGSKPPQRDNTGVLFDNSRRKKTPNHPDLRGKAMVNGQMVWISAWSKTSEAGNDYLSLAFSLMEDRQPQDDDEPPPSRRTP
jgi:hypothetical protein